MFVIWLIIQDECFCFSSSDCFLDFLMFSCKPVDLVPIGIMGEFGNSGWSALEAGAAERNTTLRRFYEFFFLFSSCWCWSSCEIFEPCSIFLREVLWKCETRQIYHQTPLRVMRENSFLASKRTHFSTGVGGLFLNILSSDVICRPVQDIKTCDRLKLWKSVMLIGFQCSESHGPTGGLWVGPQ